MATIRRLVIVREGKDGPAIFQELLERFKGELDATVEMPVQVLPIAWGVTEKPSHVGVVLTGLKLKKLIELKEWEVLPAIKERTTVVDMPEKKDGEDTKLVIEVALSQFGLRIHPLAD